MGTVGKVSSAGRPRRVWTEEERKAFENACSVFCTKKEVCSILKMAPHTLDKNIAETYPETPTWAEVSERLGGPTKVRLRVAQIKAASEGNVSMLIFLGKNYLGQNNRIQQTTEQPKKAEVRAIDGFRSKSPVAKKAAGE